MHDFEHTYASHSLSNGARSGLTGFVAGLSRRTVAHNVTINNLLPGIHATDRADSLDAGVVKAKGITMEEARKERAEKRSRGAGQARAAQSKRRARKRLRDEPLRTRDPW